MHHGSKRFGKQDRRTGARVCIRLVRFRLLLDRRHDWNGSRLDDTMVGEFAKEHRSDDRRG